MKLTQRFQDQYVKHEKDAQEATDEERRMFHVGKREAFRQAYLMAKRDVEDPEEQELIDKNHLLEDLNDRIQKLQWLEKENNQAERADVAERNKSRRLEIERLKQHIEIGTYDVKE